MFKLVVIALFLYFFIRTLFRLMYPQMPERFKNPKPLEMKACEYCGILTIEDKCVVRKGHIFCGRDHAQRFFL